MQAPVGFVALALFVSTAVAQISLPQRILYRIDGPAPQTWFAEPVQGGIGDMNRDGHADFMAVQPHRTVFLYSGRTGTELYRFSQSVGGFGQNGCLSPAGDVNKDGFMDLLVGAAGGGNNGVGRVWVVSGSYIFSKAGNEVLYTFDGEATGGADFANVGWAGDVNNDGYEDILIGDHAWDDTGGVDHGKAYLYSGKDGKLLYSRKGTQASQFMGSSVYGCADINKDGFDDLVIGSRGYNNGLGRIEVISGLYITTSAPPEVLYARNGENAGDNLGGWFNNVIEAGVDINKDTWPDIVVAAPGFDGPSGGNTGKVYVISGRHVHTPTGNAEFIHQLVGNIAGSNLGTDVNIVEDVNGDGHDDIAASSTMGAGLCVVWSGKDGKELFRVAGESSSKQFGYRIDGAGDVNNDGYGDLVVGDWDHWAGGATRGVGRCYVISGRHLMLESYQHRHAISGAATTQSFALDAGVAHANRSYLLATSLGTGPFTLLGVRIPLSLDPWFDQALPLILSGNPFFPKWTGTLDAAGKAATSWTLPSSTNSALIGMTLFQAYVVHQAGAFHAASNAVPMSLVR